MCVISHCWCIFYVLQRFFPNFTEKPYWIFLMKKVIIITYWVIAVLLISLIVLSLGYRFSESLFIGAVFLPGAFFSIYFPERISRQGSLKDMLYVITGTLVAEIFLILSAHFIIVEMRNDFASVYTDYFDLPGILVNPVFIMVLIVAFAAGNFFIWKWLEKKFPSDNGKVTFVSERHKVSLVKNEIEYVESNDTQTFVVDGGGKRYRNRTPISQWENLLGKDFIRIHRSYLVRRGAVNEVRGDSVYVSSGAVLPLSRGYKDRVVAEFVSDNSVHH